VLDAGDLFFAKPQLTQAILPSAQIRARTLVQGFNHIGTDAINIGDNDLAAGLPFLKTLSDSAEFPFLSATLTDPSGNPIFTPYTIVERGNLRVALIGASSGLGEGDGFHSLDLLPTLEQVVAEVESSADLVILLFHGSDRDKQALVTSGLSIDLILQSHVTRYDPDFGKGSIPVSALGNQGKYLNLITATIRAPEQPLHDLTIPRRTITFVEKSRERLRRNRPEEVPLKELYADNPKILERIEDLERREAEAKEMVDGALNTLESERVRLNRKITDDKDLLALVNAAKAAIEKVSPPATVQKRSQRSSTRRAGRIAARDGP
jgi:2',3'-cyclic-nucleotide 2'-phosphodiesterase (5'-nucleotidase family)